MSLSPLASRRRRWAQVVIGLAITQDGIPIAHRVFPGSTVDVTTLGPMAEEPSGARH